MKYAPAQKKIIARAAKTALLLSVFLFFVGSGASQTQVTKTIQGVVRDANGNPIAGAQVSFRGGSFTAQSPTDNQGAFELYGVTARNGVISVHAPGFETQHRSWDDSQAGTIAFALAVAPLAQQVTVTANRIATPVGQTAGTVAVLPLRQIADTPALSLDGVLRQIPGFSLFRRTDSRVANPTTQGVSLRGVGASGASRALVLENGIPLNDPFGGWVYWDRVPRVAVDRIEVAEGGASDLYGSDAMGGVINILTRQASRSQASLDASYGNEDTPDASFWAGTVWRKWTGDISTEAFGTDGYVLVPEDIRGPVDTAAGSNHADLTLNLARQISNHLRAFASGDVFGEARKNGTPIQTNRTHLRELTAGLDWQSSTAGLFSVRGFGEAQLLDQNFSSIAASRASETLVDLQRVPAQEVGFSLQWQREFGSLQTWVAGVDATAVRGASNEHTYARGAVNNAVGAGGRQDIQGLYAEDILRLTPRWIFTAAARYDHWRNFDAFSVTTPIAKPGPTAVTNFTPRVESAFSPRLSLLYQVTSALSLYASAFRAFRAPTLNELYRPFRVGNVLTLSNSALGPERLDGAEAGAGFAPAGGRLRLHAALFWDQINQPIANVTLSTTPSLITDQRQNLGSTLSRGVEIEARERIWSDLLLTQGYQYAKATVLSFPGNAALMGLNVPQTPRNAFTFGASYSKARLGAFSLEGRYTGVQYDDVLNKFPLDAAFELDAMASHAFHQHFEVYGALENLTGVHYEVARVPYTELGPPILGRIGVRINWGAQ